MGVRNSVIVSITSFLLGSLFTHWIADSLTLWKSPVTDRNLWISASYYAIIAKSPVEGLYFLAFVMAIGAGSILLSLRRFRAPNLMFDTASIFLYITSVIMYIYSVVPNIFTNFTHLPLHESSDVFPHALRSPTIELASNNLVCSVALTGVLFLQAGRFWAEKYDAEDDADRAEEKRLRQEARIAAGKPLRRKSSARRP